MTRGHISSWNYDPNSKFRVELWTRLRIQHCDSGTKFNVNLRPEVIFQRGINAHGLNSMGVQILSVRRVVIQWPLSGGYNSTWNIRSIKTPRVEDVEILLPVKFCWIPFSGFREVQNVSNNKTPGGPSWFSNQPENTHLVDYVEILLPIKFRWTPFSGLREVNM